VIDKLPPEIQQATIATFGLLPTSLLARFLWHHRQVVLGRRKFWSWDLLWEGPTAALCAIVGGGLASYLGMDALASHAMVGVVGWLGPRGIETVIAEIVRRYSGGGKTS